MSAVHEPWIVVLSILVALQGSYVGVYLARQIGQARGMRYRQLITFSALSLALGVWTMHFLGLLALQLSFAVNFLVLPTLISFLVCILVIGVAVFVVGRPRPSGLRIAVAALFMGLGIVAMHYIGMMALHAATHMAHSPAFVLASAVVGITAAGLSLWLGFADSAPRSITGAAVVMALAISAMHYIAMWGTTMVPHLAHGVEPQPALSPGALALVVTGLAFTISGLFLLTLMPLPAEASAVALPAPPRLPEAGPPVIPPPALPSVAAPAEAVVADVPPPKTLPVEQAGSRRSLDIARLIAVQAQAHYTQLFDGEAVWFCPLTISEVEARLDAGTFIRIHRSHIVKLGSIVAMQRSGDAAIVELRTVVGYRAPTFVYHRPTSVADAVGLLASPEGDVRLLAGGHSLIPMMKLRMSLPDQLVDLGGLAELRSIGEEAGHIVIGAATTQAALIGSELLARHVPLLRETALQIADPQIRTRGTLGGNIANGDPGNDMPAVMQCLDAVFLLRGADGERQVLAREFYLGVYTTALNPGELITAIRIPMPPPGHGWAYEKLKRKIGDYATAAAAVVLTIDRGRVATASITLTNVGPTPLIAHDAWR